MTDAQLAWGTTLALFVLGAAGLVVRRQLLAMLLSLELMTNAVNVAIVFTARRLMDPAGLAVVLIVLAVAACEAVVGISLILSLYRHEDATETQEIARLRG